MRLHLILLSFICLSQGIVVCPDGTSGCPDGMTCCLVNDREYGCCPLENAVCCEDHSHCCPHGSRCDTAEGKCLSSNTGRGIDWHRKRPSFKVQPVNEESLDNGDTVTVVKARSHNPRLPWSNRKNHPIREITCADRKSKCPDHTTCCEMDKGVYGCCPVEDAVCCEDHLHCCPHGTHCDVAAGKCTNSNGDETPWFKKFPSSQIHRKSAIELSDAYVDCDNGEKCPSDGHCCMDSNDEAYCCPFPNGVCCKGATHCCPHGFRCVSLEGKCVQEENSIMVSMDYEPTKEAVEYDNTEKKTICPDNKSFCRDHETCCKTYDAIAQAYEYKCCKLNHATCCEDSCCPRGYHCVDNKKCERSAFVGRHFYQ